MLGRLAANHGFGSPHAVPTGPTAWLAPAIVLRRDSLPYFWVLLFCPLVCLLAFNVFCSSATAAVIYVLGLRCFDRRVAFTAALAWAVWPDAMGLTARLWNLVWQPYWLFLHSGCLVALRTSRVLKSGRSTGFFGAPPSEPSAACHWPIPTAYLLLRNPRILHAPPSALPRFFASSVPGLRATT